MMISGISRKYFVCIFLSVLIFAVDSGGLYAAQSSAEPHPAPGQPQSVSQNPIQMRQLLQFWRALMQTTVIQQVAYGLRSTRAFLGRFFSFWHVSAVLTLACDQCKLPITLDVNVLVTSLDKLFQLWAADELFEDDNFKKLYIKFNNFSAPRHLLCLAKDVVEGITGLPADYIQIAKHYLDIVGPVWLPKPYNPDWIEAYESVPLFNYGDEFSARIQRRAVRSQYLAAHDKFAKMELTGAAATDPATIETMVQSGEIERHTVFSDKVYEQIKPNFRGDFKNLIRFFDTENKALKFGAIRFKASSYFVHINQFSALYQFYPSLSKLVLYGDRFNELCGYYAAYFAKVFAEHHNEPSDIVKYLNDRDRFEVFLTLARQKIEAYRVAGSVRANLGTYNLSGDEIGLLLNEPNLINQNLRQNIIISGCERDVEKDVEDLIKNLGGSVPFIVWILSAPRNFADVGQQGQGHWICVLAKKNFATSQFQLTIADSAGRDRCETAIVKDIAQNLSKLQL